MGLGSEYLPAMPVYAAAVLACGAYYVLFGVLHELAHLGAARLLGCRGCLTWRNARDACCSRSVTVAGASGWRRGVIRHAAWVASVALAIAAGPGWRTARRAAAAATAAEALASDLFRVGRASERQQSPAFDDRSCFLSNSRLEFTENRSCRSW